MQKAIIEVSVKENALLAAIAARSLQTQQVAIVFGKKIYLHNTTTVHFLNNTKWVRHEVAHVLQYKRYGFITFLFLYLISFLQKGYKKNRFEVEATKAESDDNILQHVTFRKTE